MIFSAFGRFVISHSITGKFVSVILGVGLYAFHEVLMTLHFSVQPFLSVYEISVPLTLGGAYTFTPISGLCSINLQNLFDMICKNS